MANARIQINDRIWRQIKTTAVESNTSASAVVNDVLSNYFSPTVTFTSAVTPTINSVEDAKTVAEKIAARPVPKPTSRKKVRPKTFDVKPGETSEW